MIHRDIKPANILVDENCNLILCDFGLARTLGTKKRPMTAHVVSRWYRAPEVILGNTSYDQSLDVWSVGCVLAELIGFTDQYRQNNQIPFF